MSIKMKELPISERPYEKLEMFGEEALTNAELLAIIIKSGTKEDSSIILAQKILSLVKNNNCKQDNLKFLQEISIEEFMKIKGIGRVKAIQLKAVCELAKRISKPIEKIKIKITKPIDIANLFMEEMKNEKREIVKVVILNSKNIIMKVQKIALGGISSAQVSTRNVFEEAIRIGEPKIILIHNHPSGDSTPSKQDVLFTKQIEKAAEILGVEFLDHIVIGEDEYTSIKSYEIKNNKECL